MRGYLAAISTVHEKCEGVSPGSYPLATKFLRGVRRSKPVLFFDYFLTHILLDLDLLVVRRQ